MRRAKGAVSRKKARLLPGGGEGHPLVKKRIEINDADEA